MLNSFQKPQHLQSILFSSNLPISLPAFAFTVLFKSYFNVLCSYFHVSLSLVRSSQSLNLAKFRDTAPLHKEKFSPGCLSSPLAFLEHVMCGNSALHLASIL